MRLLFIVAVLDVHGALGGDNNFFDGARRHELVCCRLVACVRLVVNLQGCDVLLEEVSVGPSAHKGDSAALETALGDVLGRNCNYILVFERGNVHVLVATLHDLGTSLLEFLRGEG